jgi:hypothetical protein
VSDRFDKSVIPAGDYCHEPDGSATCPYWSSTPEPFPDNAGLPDYARVAHCNYLGKNDVDLACHPLCIYTRERGEIDPPEVADWLEYGMLWDQLKMCGVNA